MNLHQPNTKPDELADSQLDALLDEALAVGDVPADLQDRVLALTDPALNAQLDRALAPGVLPEKLHSRVMQRVQTELAAQPRPVLATIANTRRAWVGYAAAAAIVLAAGAAFYFVSGISMPQTPGTVVEVGPVDTTEIEDALAFAEDTELDQRLSSLESRILSVSSESIWGSDDDFQRELWLELTPDDEGEGLLF